MDNDENIAVGLIGGGFIVIIILAVLSWLNQKIQGTDYTRGDIIVFAIFVSVCAILVIGLNSLLNKVS